MLERKLVSMHLTCSSACFIFDGPTASSAHLFSWKNIVLTQRAQVENYKSQSHQRKLTPNPSPDSFSYSSRCCSHHVPGCSCRRRQLHFARSIPGHIQRCRGRRRWGLGEAFASSQGTSPALPPSGLRGARPCSGQHPPGNLMDGPSTSIIFKK